MLWQVSGFVLTYEPALLTTARTRRSLGGEASANNPARRVVVRPEDLLFPEQVFTGSLGQAHDHLGDGDPDEAPAVVSGAPTGGSRSVSNLVERTVDALAIQERLVVCLKLDPVLIGRCGVFSAQTAIVPSRLNPRRAIADRTDVCIVQTQPSVVLDSKIPVPPWERIRVLEITAPDTLELARWAPRLRTIPMVDVNDCGTPEALSSLLEIRPHVVICHDASVLGTANLGSAYIIALPQLADGHLAPYQQIARLLERCSAVLVLDDMAASRFAHIILDRLCRKGTLTDALLGLHLESRGESGVTVCARDPQLRLRDAPSTADAAHPAIGRAVAWVPLGDRLRADWEGQEVRVVALSGHRVTVQAELRPARVGLEEIALTGPLPEAVQHEVERRCRAALAGHRVSAVVGVTSSALDGLDETEAICQAAEAAVQRALSGRSDGNTYLVAAEDGSTDTPLPTHSPVLLDGVARASVPWRAERGRKWCRWSHRRDAPGVEPDGIRLVEPLWPEEGREPENPADVLSRALEWHQDEILNAFSADKYRIAKEFMSAEQILVSDGHLLWPSLRSLPHATQIVESP